MGKDCTNGKTAGLMMESTFTTRSMVLVFIRGLMDASMRDIGKMENGKVKANISYHREYVDKASGIRIRGLSGPPVIRQLI